MAAHYAKPVILLIDEYDVLLAKAGDHGYYGEMLNIMRAFLGIVWKTNPYLQFAVVTGCLRIAKESIFTGANNFIVCSISQAKYSCYFGFTENEVERMLKEAEVPEYLPEIKSGMIVIFLENRRFIARGMSLIPLVSGWAIQKQCQGTIGKARATTLSFAGLLTSREAR